MAWVVPLTSTTAFFIFFGQFCLEVWPRDVPSLGWRAVTLAALSLAVLAAGALLLARYRVWLRNHPVGAPLVVAMIIAAALVAGLASGTVFEEATKDLGRNYFKAPAADRLTPSLTAARYFVTVAASGLVALSVAVAFTMAARRAASGRVAIIVITVAAAAVVASATCALLAGPLGKADWLAAVSSDYTAYCGRHPAEAYCAKGSPPISDYFRPYGEFTSLAGLALAVGVGLPLGVAGGATAALGCGSRPWHTLLGAASGTGTVLGSGILSAAFLYLVNLNSPLTFSYSYHPPPGAAAFGLYCLVMLAGSIIFVVGAPTLLAHFSIQTAGRMRAEETSDEGPTR